MMKSTVLALSLTLGVVGCGVDDPPPLDDSPDDQTGLARPVVRAAQPLALENTTLAPVRWPIWGGAMSLGEPARVEVELGAANGSAAGLAFAGPPDALQPEERTWVELVRGDGVWILQETSDGTVVKSEEVQGAVSEDLVIELGAAGASIKVNGASEATLEPTKPLASDGAVGMYALIGVGATLGIDALATSEPLPHATDLGEPLRELADARGITIGSATDIWPPDSDLGFEVLMADQFGMAAPTELYMPTTRGEDPDFFFVPADLMVNYATVHGQHASGYFLVWDFELPQWVTDLAASGDAAALGQVYDDHITTTVSRYQGRVTQWVVVNEAIWGPEVTETDTAELAQTIWSDVLGADYIERAFRVAREADPQAILLYNETGAEEIGPKSDFLYDMAVDFVGREVPIDGIGFQFHIDAASPPDMESVKANMERFAALGLSVHITELDVNLVDLTGTPEENLELQAELYGQVVGTCLAVPACKSITIFGVSDRYAWDEQEQGSAAPLLFDENYQAKPAYFAIQALLQSN